MRILLTGHKGYIGAMAGPILRAAGHEVIGLDTDLFAGCEFGEAAVEIPEIRKDLRDLTKKDLGGFDAVVHLAALSNDPLGDLDADVTYDINHWASVRLAELAKEAGAHRFVFSSSCSTYGAAGDVIPRRDGSSQPGNAVCRVQGLGRARHSVPGGRAFQPNLLAQCDSVWRVSTLAAGYRLE